MKIEDSRIVTEMIGRVQSILGRTLTGVEKRTLLRDFTHTYKEVRGRLYNSYLDESAVDPYRDISVLSFIETVKKRQPVIAGNCTLYKGQKNGGKNVTGEFVQYLLDTRSSYKSNRDKLKRERLDNLSEIDKLNPKKSKDVEVIKSLRSKNEHLDETIRRDDMYQKVFKILVNAYYGSIGMPKFIFNDENSGPAVTGSGVHIITTLIRGLEAFIGNNWFFSNISDILYFLHLSNEKGRGRCNFPVSKKITGETLKKYLFKKLRDPSKIEKYPKIVAQIDTVIKSMSQEQIEDAFFRNNLIRFLDNPHIIDLVGECLEEFIPSGNVSDVKKMGDSDVAKKIITISDAIIDVVLFPHYFEDRYNFAMEGKNSTVLLVDTDSVFVYMDYFFQLVSKYFEIYNEDGSISPELRLTLGSVFTYPVCIATEIMLDEYARAHNLDPELRKELYLKNEFFFKRLVLTPAMKNYMTMTMSQEGVIKNPMEMTIKGLPIKKSTTPKRVRDYFSKLIEEDILTPEKIDINKILNKYVWFSQELVKLIKEGCLDFSKPMRYGIKYKNPFSQEVVRGTVLWNAVMKDLSKIEPLDNVMTVKLKANTEAEFNEIIQKNLDFFTDEDKELLKKVRKCIFYTNDELKKFGLSALCIPRTEEVIPHWAIPFIDVELMVKNCLSPTLIILKSLGIMVDDVGREERMTNIVDL